MRTVTVTAAILAILFSALAHSSELDHRVLPVQVSITSDTVLGLGDDGHASSEAETNCHAGYSCLFVIIPSENSALTRFHSELQLFHLAVFLPSEARNPPFEPPRILSLV
tara:strand:+ start:78 stop:407 length:330 start_codon:yes stop_codon:yes gene_type:complete